MSKPWDSDKPPISGLERWWRVCDAMAETVAEHPDALRDSEDVIDHDWPLKIALSLPLKMDLAHWSRPDESVEEYISRLKQEAASFIYDRMGDEPLPGQSLEEFLSRFMQRHGWSSFALPAKAYLRRISELEKAEGIPPSITVESQNDEAPPEAPSEEPSNEVSKKREL